ncbi:YbaY family lipoprotein [Parasedimentitalea psychrophila]|uniref:YbaY family lipoprotein n=1 Tax=Parasedimentitalea psychrophila TaxID=2997337 RepID=A0A9Y2KZD0_9RHOB|nr:YbaY family lipoprotein [Parasedimentitalea psychrophila]WIY23974.1 YbaY family lipoprotein [Parasedimentitalea psychrophila]
MDIKTGFMALVLATSTAIAGVSMAKAGTVDGSVTYLQRIAVPPGARLLVELRDVSLADAPSKLLTAQDYDLSAVPFDYSLSFADSDIVDNLSYAVSARITLDGTLLFITDTTYPVLTRGAGHRVDMIVKPVPTAASGSADMQLDNTSWNLIELNGAAVDKGRDPGIVFAMDGQFSTSAGCNRFMGQAQLNGSEISFPDRLAGTLMACAPGLDVQENDFLAALAKVKSIERQGPLMQMLAEDGSVLMVLTLGR